MSMATLRRQWKGAWRLYHHDQRPLQQQFAGTTIGNTAGPGTGITGYNYLTSSATLPFSLSVGTPRAGQQSRYYRKAYLYVLRNGANYTVTMKIQHGNTIYHYHQRLSDYYPSG